MLTWFIVFPDNPFNIDPPMPFPMDWSYIAGYFDGEGTANIVPNHGHDSWKFSIVFSNTNLESLEAMRKFSGDLGAIYTYDRKRPDPEGGQEWKISHMWSIQAHEQVLFFIDHVLEHTIIKHDKLAEMKQRIEAYAWREPHDTPEFRNKLASHVHNSKTTKSLRKLEKEWGISAESIRKYLKKYGLHKEWLIKRNPKELPFTVDLNTV
jgi:hypothetical protein